MEREGERERERKTPVIHGCPRTFSALSGAPRPDSWVLSSI